MEDFLKFLLIAGVILVGIFKEVNKNKKPGKRPVSPMPSSDEIKPDAVPMPEAWSNPKRKKKREEVSVAASIANSAAQDKRNIPIQRSRRVVARQRTGFHNPLGGRSPTRHYLGRDSSTKILSDN